MPRKHRALYDPAIARLEKEAHMPRLRWPAFIVLLMLGAALVAACGDDDDDDDDVRTATATATETATAAATATEDDHGGATVAVALSEWAVAPEVASAGHGETTFTVANEGAAPHELVVVRTDLGAEELPTDAGLVDESAVEVLGRTSQMAAGTTEQLTVDLEDGSYVLVCNIPGHYDLGMRVAFTVE
jgi:uncharacterized cupredoxin-like copper-binding protein